MAFWTALWTITWYGGLAIFTYLAIAVTINGFGDLRALMQTLDVRHAGAPGPDAGSDA